MNKPNLYDLDLQTLENLLISWGEPRYRADQIWTWLYQHLVNDISEMTSLPKSLRAQLEDKTCLIVPRLLESQESLDGETRKDLLAFPDGTQIEVVLMRYIERRSVCVSSQAGCSAGCQFCATGQMGFERNLSSGEILAQVLHIARELKEQAQHLTHIVFMGMGEPFFNYDNVIAAMYRLNDPKALGIGQRRITMSTAGVVPGIRRFTKEDTQVNLAVSLHAATDELRDQLMPINRRHNINALFTAVGDYIAQTNRRVTFEWALINEVNDTSEQAQALAARLEGMLAYVNLIPLNPTTDYEGIPSRPPRIEAFVEILDRHHIPYTLRLRRGMDIQAGCGQLRRRTLD